MPDQPKSRGRPPKLKGKRDVILADAVYPVNALLRRLGISRNSLASMRKQGLRVHYIGRRCAIVDGHAFVTFLRQQWAQEEHPDE
jgi:hypothetical protein